MKVAIAMGTPGAAKNIEGSSRMVLVNGQQDGKMVEGGIGREGAGKKEDQKK